MIIPRPLKEGDSVGVTAPSAGMTDEKDILRFSNAKRKLRERGYGTVETPDTYMCDEDGRSASAEQRVREFNGIMGDPGVPVVFAASGGDYESEMLPLMDWSVVEGNPKWFQGYSDNTVLLFKITAEHDIATIYGGNFGDLGMEPWHRSVEENLEFLEGRRTSQASFRRHAEGFTDRITGLEPFSEDADTVWRSSVGDVTIEGRLIGGCMDVIEWFVLKDKADATGFVRKYRGDGIVWYLETYDMDTDRVGRTLGAMREKGWLDGCTGMVFGRPLFYDGPVSYEDAVTAEVGDMGFPILFDADVGHKAPRMTFINGALARFDFADGACVLTYDLDNS